MATSATTVIAAMAARARREIREHFERNNAFDRQHAVPYDPPGPMHRRQFDLLIGRGLVREVEEGLYWFDREAARLEDERNRAAAILVFKIVVIGFAIRVAAVGITSALR
jgi:hypothetical protein